MFIAEGNVLLRVCQRFKEAVADHLHTCAIKSIVMPTKNNFRGCWDIVECCLFDWLDRLLHLFNAARIGYDKSVCKPLIQGPLRGDCVNSLHILNSRGDLRLFEAQLLPSVSKISYHIRGINLKLEG